MLAGSAGAANAQYTPTPDRPLILVQPDFESGVGYRLPPADAVWHEQIIPMLPVGIEQSWADTPAEAIAELKARRHTLRTWILTHAGQAAYEDYLDKAAVEIFNLGGKGLSSNVILNPDVPTKFFHAGTGDDMSIPLLSWPEAATGTRLPQVQPWMGARLPVARQWFDEFLALWTSSSDPDPLPTPFGGVYFDTELVPFPGSERNWVHWAKSMENDARWASDPVPDYPGSTGKTMAARWADAAAEYGWPSSPAAAVNSDFVFSTDPNRQYFLFFADVMHQAIGGGLHYAGYLPILDATQDPAHPWYGADIPVVNYGDEEFDNRATQGNERLGLRDRRQESTDPIKPSRSGWFAEQFNYWDGPATSECDDCRKYPYRLRSSGTGAAVVGPWQGGDYNHPMADMHAPVFYHLASGANGLMQTNYYLPPTALVRTESTWDASLRTARETLDILNYSGVSSDKIAPWIPAPNSPIGFPGCYVASPDDIRRMLMLMRAKQISRIQMFQVTSGCDWTYLGQLYEDVYRPTYTGVYAEAGTLVGSDDVDAISNVVPTAGDSSDNTVNVVSEVLGDAKGATSTIIKLGGMESTNPSAIALRLRLECEVAFVEGASPNSPCSVAPTGTEASLCERDLRGYVYLWNWNQGKWHQIWFADRADGGYSFPACHEPGNTSICDYSTRRDILLDYVGFEIGNFVMNGAMKIKLVHQATSTGSQFVSKWDLVQACREDDGRLPTGWRCPTPTNCDGWDDSPSSPGSASGQTPGETTTPPGESMASAPTGADINFDGSVTAADLTDFSNAYVGAGLLADYNGDEEVTSDDALTFLTDFVEQIED
jgi:hypothetical protein